MFNFIGWLVIGFIAGGLARFFVPGPQPMGLLATTTLGLLGSLLGGFVSILIFGENPADPGFHAGGLIMSIIGAVVALALFLRSTSRRLGP